MFHVKHSAGKALFPEAMATGKSEAYSGAGKTQLQKQVENQKENAI